MIQDRQVGKLRNLLAGGMSLYLAAMKTGMDEKTARKYRDSKKQPSELASAHDWWTRRHWDRLWLDVVALLEDGDQAKLHFLGPLVCTPSEQMPGGPQVLPSDRWPTASYDDRPDVVGVA